MQCITCAGTGSLANRICPTCLGTGQVLSEPAEPRATSPERSTDAVRRHIADIFGSRKTGPAIDPDEDLGSLSDMELRMRVLEVGKRVSAERAFIMSGQVEPAGIATLQDAIDAYRRIEAVADGQSAVEVRQGLADATGLLASAHERLGELEAAEARYVEAGELWATAGDTDRVAATEESLRALRLYRDRDTDAELLRLQEELESAASPLDRAEIELRLGELCLDAGDSFGSTHWFEAAEGTLQPFEDSLGGVSTANALIATMQAITSGEDMQGAAPIVESTRIRTLYKRLYFGMSQALRTTDPSRTEHYLAKAEALDATIEEGDQDNLDFSRTMMEFLKDGGFDL